MDSGALQQPGSSTIVHVKPTVRSSQVWARVTRSALLSGTTSPKPSLRMKQHFRCITHSWLVTALYQDVMMPVRIVQSVVCGRWERKIIAYSKHLFICGTWWPNININRMWWRLVYPLLDGIMGTQWAPVIPITWTARVQGCGVSCKNWPLTCLLAQCLDPINPFVSTLPSYLFGDQIGVEGTAWAHSSAFVSLEMQILN
jgi:hypothetical protein